MAIFAVLLIALVVAMAKGFRRPRSAGLTAFLTFAFHAPLGFVNGLRGSAPLTLANIGEGFHLGNVSKLADGAYTRNLFVKNGSDTGHVALAGTADIAIGVIDDDSSAAEDPLNVLLLGSIRRTILVQTSAAVITQGDYVVTAANGQARTLPATTGTYYINGRALNTTAGNAGDIVEIDPCVPVQRVVA